MARKRNTPETLRAQARAGAKVRSLVRAGKMPPPTKCEACGDGPSKIHSIVYHHWRGYDPATGADTDVVALCVPCHRGTHAGSVAEVRTGRIREDIAHPATVTPRVRYQILDAYTNGRTWVRYVLHADFLAAVEEARVVGEGSVERGFVLMVERHQEKVRKAQAAREAAWEAERREAAERKQLRRAGGTHHDTGGEPVTVINRPRKRAA